MVSCFVSKHKLYYLVMLLIAEMRQAYCSILMGYLPPRAVFFSNPWRDKIQIVFRRACVCSSVGFLPEKNNAIYICFFGFPLVHKSASGKGL